MSTDLDDEGVTLTDEEAAFLERTRQVYRAYPHLDAAPSLRARRSRGPVLVAAAAAVAAVATAGYLAIDGQGTSETTVAHDPSPSEKGDDVSDPPTNSKPDRRLVPEITTQWSQQSATSCAAYQPGPSPQVVFLPRITPECLAKVPLGSTVVFSAPEADPIGGVEWSAGSQPWTEVDGVEVLRKVRGEEMTISSRFIQGIWTEEPREYAVYIGDETAVDALERLSPEHEVRTPDGSSE